MGLKYGKRKRMESMRNIDDATLASIGNTNISFEKYDEQLIHDRTNKRLDLQQEKINARD